VNVVGFAAIVADEVELISFDPQHCRHCIAPFPCL
jgi:hypothetical protein